MVDPVVGIVVVVLVAVEDLLQLLLEVAVVGFLLELERLAIAEERLKLACPENGSLLGKPLHKVSADMDILDSMILWYLSFLFLAVRPCHGRLPRKKYSIT